MEFMISETVFSKLFERVLETKSAFALLRSCKPLVCMIVFDYGARNFSKFLHNTSVSVATETMSRVRPANTRKCFALVCAP